MEEEFTLKMKQGNRSKTNIQCQIKKSKKSGKHKDRYMYIYVVAFSWLTLKNNTEYIEKSINVVNTQL